MADRLRRQARRRRVRRLGRRRVVGATSRDDGATPAGTVAHALAEGADRRGNVSRTRSPTARRRAGDGSRTSARARRELRGRRRDAALGRGQRRCSSRSAPGADRRRRRVVVVRCRPAGGRRRASSPASTAASPRPACRRSASRRPSAEADPRSRSSSGTALERRQRRHAVGRVALAVLLLGGGAGQLRREGRGRSCRRFRAARPGELTADDPRRGARRGGVDRRDGAGPARAVPGRRGARRRRRLARRDRRASRGGGRASLRLPRRGKGQALTAAERAAPPGASSSATPICAATCGRSLAADADLAIAGFRGRQGGGFGIARRRRAR